MVVSLGAVTKASSTMATNQPKNHEKEDDEAKQLLHDEDRVIGSSPKQHYLQRTRLARIT